MKLLSVIAIFLLSTSSVLATEFNCEMENGHVFVKYNENVLADKITVRRLKEVRVGDETVYSNWFGKILRGDWAKVAYDVFVSITTTEVKVEAKDEVFVLSVDEDCQVN